MVYQGDDGKGSSIDQLIKQSSELKEKAIKESFAYLNRPEEAKAMLKSYRSDIKKLKSGFKNNPRLEEATDRDMEFLENLVGEYTSMSEVGRGLNALRQKEKFTQTDYAAMEEYEKRLKEEAPNWYSIQLLGEKIAEAKKKMQESSPSPSPKPSPQAFTNPNQQVNDYSKLVKEIEGSPEMQEFPEKEGCFGAAKLSSLDVLMESGLEAAKEELRKYIIRLEGYEKTIPDDNVKAAASRVIPQIKSLFEVTDYKHLSPKAQEENISSLEKIGPFAKRFYEVKRKGEIREGYKTEEISVLDEIRSDLNRAFGAWAYIPAFEKRINETKNNYSVVQEEHWQNQTPQKIEQVLNQMIEEVKAGKRIGVFEVLGEIRKEVDGLPSEKAKEYSDIQKKMYEFYQFHDRKSPFNKLVRSALIRVHEKRKDISEEKVRDYFASKIGLDIDEEKGIKKCAMYVNKDESLENFIKLLDGTGGVEPSEDDEEQSSKDEDDKKDPPKDDESKKAPTAQNIDEFVSEIVEAYKQNKNLNDKIEKAESMLRQIQAYGDEETKKYFVKKLAYEEENNVFGLIEEYIKLSETKVEEPTKKEDKPDTSKTPAGGIASAGITKEERLSKEERTYQILRSNIGDLLYEVSTCKDPDQIRSLLDNNIPEKKRELNEASFDDKKRREELEEMIEEVKRKATEKYDGWITTVDLDVILSDAFITAKNENKKLSGQDFLNRDVFTEVLENEIRSGAVNLKYKVDKDNKIRVYDSKSVDDYVKENFAQLKEKVEKKRKEKLKELTENSADDISRAEKEINRANEINGLVSKYQAAIAEKTKKDRKERDPSWWNDQKFVNHYQEIKYNYDLIKTSLENEVDDEQINQARKSIEKKLVEAKEKLKEIEEKEALRDTTNVDYADVKTELKEDWQKLEKVLDEIKTDCDIYLGVREFKEHIKNWDEFGGESAGKNRILDELFKEDNRAKIKGTGKTKAKYDQMALIARDCGFILPDYFNSTKKIEEFRDFERTIPPEVKIDSTLKTSLNFNQELSAQISDIKSYYSSLLEISMKLDKVSRSNISEEDFQTEYKDALEAAERLKGFAKEDTKFDDFLKRFSDDVAPSIYEDFENRLFEKRRNRRSKIRNWSIAGVLGAAAAGLIAYLGFNRPLISTKVADDAELLKARQEITAANKRVSELEANIDAEVDKRNAALKEQLDQARIEINNEKTAHNNYKTENDQKLAAAEKRAAELEGNLEAEVDKRIADVNNELTAAKTQLKEQTDAVAELNDDYTALQKEKELVDKKIADIDKQLAEVNNTLKEERKDDAEKDIRLAAAEKRAAELEASVEAEVDKRNSELNDKLAQTNKKLEEERTADAAEDIIYNKRIERLENEKRVLETLKAAADKKIAELLARPKPKELTPAEKAELAAKEAEEKLKRGKTEEIDPEVKEILEKIRARIRGN